MNMNMLNLFWRLYERTFHIDMIICCRLRKAGTGAKMHDLGFSRFYCASVKHAFMISTRANVLTTNVCRYASKCINAKERERSRERLTKLLRPSHPR